MLPQVSGSVAYGLRRAAIALAVVTAHLALTAVIGQALPRPSEAVAIAWIALPLSEQRRRVPEEPAAKKEVEAARTSPAVSFRGHPASADEAPPAEEERTPVDWHEEARVAAGERHERERLERERRTLDGPSGTVMARPKHVPPPCPFERCEPGFGSDSIFEQARSKKGRIETTPEREVIRWISNNCYQILGSTDEMRRGQNRCFVPLDKQAARGDLFDRMRELPSAEERGFDVP